MGIKREMFQNVFYYILAIVVVFQCRQVVALSALDFSSDGDWEQDADGEYTQAPFDWKFSLLHLSLYALPLWLKCGKGP